MKCLEDGHDYLLDSLEEGGEQQMIRFVDRTPGRPWYNGTTHEEVIKMLIDRFQYFQASELCCRESAIVLTKLEEALHWMEHRTRLRESQGIVGLMVAHKSK